MSNASAIANRQVDPALVQDASFEMDEDDRAYIDSQAREGQKHLVQSLVGGVNATWMTLDGTSAAGSVGDVVCMVGPNVTRAVAAALTNAGGVYGILMTAGAPGVSVNVALTGAIPPAVTGLPSSGNHPYARVNQTTARVETVTSLASSDFALGTVEPSGNLSLRVQLPPATGGGGGTGGTTLSAGFTQPAIGSTVVATVLNNEGLQIGQSIAVSGGGYYISTAVSGSNSVTLLNMGSFVNATAGTPIALGSSVIPAGQGASLAAQVRANGQALTLVGGVDTPTQYAPLYLAGLTGNIPANPRASIVLDGYSSQGDGGQGHFVWTPGTILGATLTFAASASVSTGATSLVGIVIPGDTLQPAIQSGTSYVVKSVTSSAVTLMAAYTGTPGVDSACLRLRWHSDGGTCVTNTGGGWYRVFFGNAIEPPWFGAKGDGVTDDHDVLQAMAQLNQVGGPIFRIYLASTRYVSDFAGRSLGHGVTAYLSKKPIFINTGDGVANANACREFFGPGRDRVFLSDGQHSSSAAATFPQFVIGDASNHAPTYVLDHGTYMARAVAQTFTVQPYVNLSQYDLGDLNGLQGFSYVHKYNPTATIVVPATGLAATLTFSASTSVSTGAVDLRTVVHPGDILTSSLQPGTAYTVSSVTSSAIVLTASYTGTTGPDTACLLTHVISGSVTREMFASSFGIAEDGPSSTTFGLVHETNSSGLVFIHGYLLIGGVTYTVTTTPGAANSGPSAAGDHLVANGPNYIRVDYDYAGHALRLFINGAQPDSTMTQTGIPSAATVGPQPFFEEFTAGQGNSLVFPGGSPFAFIFPPAQGLWGNVKVSTVSQFQAPHSAVDAVPSSNMLAFIDFAPANIPTDPQAAGFVIAQSSVSRGKHVRSYNSGTSTASPVWFSVNVSGADTYALYTHIHDLGLIGTGAGIYATAALSTNVHDVSFNYHDCGMIFDNFSYIGDIGRNCDFQNMGQPRTSPSSGWYSDICLWNGTQFFKIGPNRVSLGAGNFHILSCGIDCLIEQGYPDGFAQGVYFFRGMNAVTLIGANAGDEANPYAYAACTVLGVENFNWVGGYIDQLYSAPTVPVFITQQADDQVFQCSALIASGANQATTLIPANYIVQNNVTPAFGSRTALIEFTGKSQLGHALGSITPWGDVSNPGFIQVRQQATKTHQVAFTGNTTLALALSDVLWGSIDINDAPSPISSGQAVTSPWYVPGYIINLWNKTTQIATWGFSSLGGIAIGAGKRATVKSIATPLTGLTVSASSPTVGTSASWVGKVNAGDVVRFSVQFASVLSSFYIVQSVTSSTIVLTTNYADPVTGNATGTAISWARMTPDT